ERCSASCLNASIANTIGGPFFPLAAGALTDTLQVGSLTGKPPPVASLTATGRMYAGGATARDSGDHTWVSSSPTSFLTYFDVLNQFQSLSQPGQNGVAGMFGVRSSDSNVPTSLTFGGIGGLFYGRND